MKRLAILLSVTLILSACHHKGKEKIEMPSPDTQECVSPPDTQSIDSADTQNVPEEKKEKQYQLQKDSLETTNLRIFARKVSVIYDPALLVGEWYNGTEHERYGADGRGRCWDSSDDVDRGEAQEFRWSMDSNILILRHHMEMGVEVPRRYVVTFVDDETLVYRDAYGRSYMLERIGQ